MVVQKNVNMQRKMGRFTLYRVALIAAVTHVDN